MAATRRASINYLLWLGIDAVIGLEMREKAKQWPMVFEKRTSKQYAEESVMMEGTGYAEVFGESEPITYGAIRQAHRTRFVHERYGLGIKVSKLAKDDNLYFQIGSKASRSLARSMRSTQESRAANIFNRATTAGYTYGDGSVLLATSHALSGTQAGTYANMISGHPEISEASLEQLVVLARKSVNEAGLPVDLEPKRLVAHQDLDFEITRLLRSKLRTATADNDINAVNYTGVFREDPVLMRYLTNTKFWGFTTDGIDGSGLVMYEREAPMSGQDTDFDTDDFLYKMTARDSFGVDDSRGFFGSDPT